MKVLVSDNLGEAGIKMFEDEEGIEVDVKTGLSPEELKNIIGEYKPDTTITVEFERDGRIKTLKLKLGDLGTEQHYAQAETSLLDGVQLSNLDAQTRYSYRIPDDIEGVLITEVDVESEAYAQNLRQGDVIVQIEKHLTPDIAALNKVLEKYKDKYKRLYINRGGRIFVTVIK